MTLLFLLGGAGAGTTGPRAGVNVHRVGSARPVRCRRKIVGYRPSVQGHVPFYAAAVPITGSTPPDSEVVWIEDLSGTIVGAVGNGGGLAGDIIEMCHEERLAEYEALWLTIPGSSAKADLFDVDVVLVWRDRRFRISAREEHHDGAQATIELEAPALWLDLADRRPAGDELLSTVTPAVGLGQLVADTNWTVGPMPVDVTTHTLSDTDATVLDLIRQWAKVCGYEVAFDTKLQRVWFVSAIGQDRGVGFRTGHNLRSLERRVEPPKATRLWAYGRDNIDITAVEPSGLPYVTDYSYYTGQGVSGADAIALYTKDEVWVDDSYVDDNDLYTAAQARLAIRAQPTYSYTCKVIDLVRVGGDGFWTHSIGDTIGVRDTVLNIDVATRVVRLKRYPFHPYDNEVELDSLQAATTESTQTRSVPGSSEWLLYRNTNDATVTLSGATEVLIALLPRFIFLDARGEYMGDSNVVATLTSSGVLRLRAVDIINSTEIGSASWSFNAATFGTWTYDMAFSQKGQSGRQRIGLYGSITSGAGSASIATDAGLAHILVRGLLTGVQLAPVNEELFDTEGTFYWTVPDGVTTIWIDAYGAGVTSPWGLGGRLKVRAGVTPGEVLQINVGGQSSGVPGGFNGGGDGSGSAASTAGGSGASDVRRGAYALVDRIMAAGGGGGPGGDFQTGGPGGDGGYPAGSAGGTGTPGGGGGTATAGGAAGTPTLGTPGAGALGDGGDAAAIGGEPGGGGGGGWYGGGAGASSTIVAGAGGGGGGSSYFDAGQDVDLVTHETGVRNGDGSVLIEW